MAVEAFALTTLINVKLYLGITNNDDDTLLELMIDQITAFIEGMMGGRRIFRTAYVNEIHDGGDHDIYLENSPIDEGETFKAEFKSGSQVSPVFTEFSLEEFVIYATAGFVHFFGRTPGRHFHNNDNTVLSTPQLSGGDRNLRFTYTAGFDPIPSDIEMLATQLVVGLFNRRNSQGVKKETVEGTSIEYFGDDGSSGGELRSLLTKEQLGVISKYRRYNFGQNL